LHTELEHRSTLGYDDSKVRSALVLALSGPSAPQRPEFVALLLKLTADKVELVRWYAIRALCNANTPELNSKLLEYLRSGESAMV
jgi:HEAT repeat protein